MRKKADKVSNKSIFRIFQKSKLFKKNSRNNKNSNGRLNKVRNGMTQQLSLKTKLIGSFVLLSLPPIIIITTILFMQSRNTIIEQISASSKDLVYKTGSNLDMKMHDVEAQAHMIASNPEFTQIIRREIKSYKNVREREAVYDMMKRIAYSNQDIKNIFIVKPTEYLGKRPKYVRDNKNFKDEFFASDLWNNIGRNSLPVWRKGLFEQDTFFVIVKIIDLIGIREVGALVIEVEPSFFLESYEAIDIEKQENFFIDETGMVLLSTNEANNNQMISVYQEFLDNGLIKNQEDGNSNGEEKSPEKREKAIASSGVITTRQGLFSEVKIFYSKIKNNWTYVSIIPTSMMAKEISQIGKSTLGVAVIIGLIVIFVGLYIAVHIAEPIHHIREQLTKVEDGNFTVKTNVKGKYEIGQLSSSFNRMTENVSKLINEVIQVSSNVTNNSDKLNEYSNTSAQASKEVVQVVESITQGATEQAKDAESTSEVVHNLVSKVNETGEHFIKVVNATNKTKEVSVVATDTMEELSKTTNETVILNSKIIEDIRSLVDRFKEISAIVNMIDGISEETNLLALNAAIEAARAGNAGKGFAVVAEEVRKLAVESQTSVRDITDIIDKINDKISKTEEALVQGSEIYNKQEEAVKETEEIFSQIIQNMEGIIKEVNEVYALAEGMDGLESKATDAISSIASIAEESAAAMEEVLASSQEQIATAEDLVGMSRQLGDIIKEMNKQVETFSV